MRNLDTNHPLVFLIGLHGVGKTTVGKHMKQMGYEHISIGNIGRMLRNGKIPKGYSGKFLRLMAEHKPGMRMSPDLVDALQEAVVHKVPPEFENLESILAAKKNELAQTEADIERSRKESERLAARVRNQAHAQNIISNLQGNIKDMLLNFSPSIIKMVREADQNNYATLEDLASHLRNMADRLSPSLV